MTRPDTALVVDAWLRLVSGLPASCIGATLPSARRDPVPDWVTDGFAQYTVVGGSPAIDVPLRRPVVQLDFWATTVDQRAVPWGRASALAERVWAWTHSDIHETVLTVPDGYDVPVLRTVVPLTEPRKVPDDPAGFARFQFDAMFTWAPSVLAVTEG